MTYAKIIDDSVAEYPLYEGDIKLRFPNTSFTVPFVVPSGYVKVIAVPQPSLSWDQNITEGVPVFNGTAWEQVWVVSDASEQEVEARTNSKAQSVRKERNSRLDSSDWTQLPDSPLNLDAKGAWQLYRETLRIIPQQQGFPWNVTWPPEPTT